MDSAIPNQINPRYRFSGKMDNAARLIPFFMIGFGLIIGYVAGKICYSCVSIRLELLICSFFVAATGWCEVKLAKLMKCRSPIWIYTSAALGAIVAMGAFNVSLVEELLDSIDIPYTSMAIWLMNPLDTLMIAGRSRSVWIFEGMVFLTTPIAAYWFYRSEVFCESCKVWLNLKNKTICLPFPISDEGRKACDKGDLALASEHCAENYGSRLVLPYVKLNYTICSRCGNCGAYQLVQVSEGKQQREESRLSPVMVLDPESAHHLSILIAKRQIKMPPASMIKHKVIPRARPIARKSVNPKPK